MKRFAFILMVSNLLTLTVAAQAKEFDAFEMTIPELQAAMERGETTAVKLVGQYLARIKAFDKSGPSLNAMIYINPKALEAAAALDRERATKGARGPLHGIPIVLKDNYDTFDMPTTASAVALTGFVTPDDGYQVKKLREAGAIFIGKTNMHEFARGIETISSLGGQTLNPYDPRRVPGGSSGGTGSAVAANFAAIGMGSDTCGSIRIPAAVNNLFGLRVTQGLSSRDGIIPLSHTQDVGGPLARSMVDLVTVLDATVGVDVADKQTAVAKGRTPKTYRDYLKVDGLKGAKLGLLTSYLSTSAPFGEVTKVIKQAVDVMKEQGAEVVELNIEGLSALIAKTSVIGLEFKFDLEKYLKEANAPVKSLTEVIESGRYHVALENRYKLSNKAEPNSEEYQKRLERRKVIAQMLIKAMKDHDLDALVFPTLRIKPTFVGESLYGGTCQISAHSGLPAISIPAGFTADGLPVGIELLAKPFDEGRLIGLSYAYEQAAKPRRSPARTPSLVSDTLSYHFEINTPHATGKLRLDRGKQTLYYDLKVPSLDGQTITDIKVHRGASNTIGPIIELLGNNTKGSVSIKNSDMDILLKGELYLMVYTEDAPYGTMRGQIVLNKD